MRRAPSVPARGDPLGHALLARAQLFQSKPEEALRVAEEEPQLHAIYVKLEEERKAGRLKV